MAAASWIAWCQEYIAVSQTAAASSPCQMLVEGGSSWCWERIKLIGEGPLVKAGSPGRLQRANPPVVDSLANRATVAEFALTTAAWTDCRQRACFGQFYAIAIDDRSKVLAAFSTTLMRHCSMVAQPDEILVAFQVWMMRRFGLPCRCHATRNRNCAPNRCFERNWQSHTEPLLR